MHPVAAQPAFNNRFGTFELVEGAGQRMIRYRRREHRPYPPEVLEAARVIRDHPCRYIPAVYEICPHEITGEYLEQFVPLAKAGITSSIHRGLYFRAKRRGRFRRRHLKPYLLSVSRHFDAFIRQLDELGQYLQHHELWHDDVIPQNIMWHKDRLELRLVDIAAFFPRRLIEEGRRLPYTHRRDRGVFRLDYSIDIDYVRQVFLQDLDPWWRVLMRKHGFGTRQ